MKNNKIAFLAPILVVVCAVGILLIRTSYSAPTSNIVASSDESKLDFFYIRRNMLSHHKISNNNNEGSGTILIKSGDKSSVGGTRKIVYCAHKGHSVSQKKYKKVSIKNAADSKIRNHQNELTAIMATSYPYISMSELKEKIKAGIGNEEYEKYNFDALDAQEAMTATQAAIWNAIADKESSKYLKTVDKLVQGDNTYYHFQNFHKEDGSKNGAQWVIKWDKAEDYNITTGCFNGPKPNYDCGSKSTFLAPGDTAESVAHYNKGKEVQERIDTLIDWYFTLKQIDETLNIAPNFSIQSSSVSWTNEGKSLSVIILANNDNFTYASENEYKISFIDSNGNSLVASNTPVMSGSKIIGYKYVINDITTKSVIAKISYLIPSDTSNVYIYESDKDSQYFIGIEPGNIPLEKKLTISNEDAGKVYLYKTKLENGISKPSITYDGKKDNICGSGTANECQEGARFNIYYADKETLAIDEPIETGKEPIELNLPLGTYYIQEVFAPVGYTSDDNLYEFKIETKDTIVAVHYNNIPTKVCIQKVSSADQSLVDGAKIQIMGMLGGIYEEFNTSSQEGLHCTAAAQLPEGVYYISETEAPPNFVKSNTIYRIFVGNFTEDDIAEEITYNDGTQIVDLQLKTVNGVPNVAVIENKPGTVITKSDLATGECVEGAHLVVKDENGSQVDEWTSTCEEGNDSHTLELSEGKYTLTEELTPSGYATAESIEFQVSSDGKVNTSLDMKDAPINACFMKVSGSKEGIAGAEFTIYDSNNQEYKKFTSTDGEVCFQYMPVGKYKIRETNAPEGYEKLEEDIEIEVKDTNETQRFKINNEAIANKTAQDSSQLVIIIASIFMLVGLGLVGYYGYKKQS